MSERSHTVPAPEGEYFESSRFAGLSLLLGSVALVALVLCAVVFLGFFAFAALALRRFSSRQDKDGNPRFTIGMRKVSFISLPMFALCLTFGAFDWLMSLNYSWFSTMFGVYIFAGAAGSSM